MGEILAMIKDKILIVDDDPSVIETLEIILTKDEKEVDGISNPNIISQTLDSKEYDVILLDMNFKAGIMSGNEGFYWLKEIRKKNPDVLVIMITAYGDYELVVRAIKEGAIDFVVKPWENEKLISTINAACKLQRTRKELIQVNKKNYQLSKEINRPVEELIGSSPKMNELKETIEKVSATDANVLILGENGTGKELVARKIHSLSERSNQVFISVDLGSLNENLFESELFGHKKGAFTDAFEDKTGRIEIAS
ncbi:MAG: sigma-54-dependent Fis family transcriptional regulator, partial [Bacteroidales bacterium]|nr:sigma-54-dependent Fis family transcriptional regulator [Bacteroidales bacterium]